ncbi:adenosine receptor A2b-like [Rhopilema esculentum]|uniref:adenosine receptor A2b-like n=1 Tax=Rhopilema esculentum TaxID=499914 RepID=UPI0031DBA338|eukprot:gene11568-21803_t
MANYTSNTVCFHLQTVPFVYNQAVVSIAALSASLHILGAIFATVGNLLVLQAFVRKSINQSASNYLLAGLCLSDCLVGATTQTSAVVLRISEAMGKHLCTLKTVYGYLSFLFGMTTIGMIGLISIDRWLGTQYPIRYKAADRKTRTWVTISAALYLVSFAIVTLAYSGVLPTDGFYKFTIVYYVIVLGMVIIFYIKIGRVLMRRNQVVSTMSVGMKKEVKRNKTIMIIITAFIIFYIPKITHKCISYFGVKDSTFLYAARIPETLIQLNSSFNPFIYILRSADVRKSIMDNLKIFEICGKRKQQSDASGRRVVDGI